MLVIEDNAMLAAIGLLLGLLLILVGLFWFIGTAFRLNPDLGAMCLLLGTVFQVILFAKNPRDTWKPLLIEIVGFLVLFFSLGAAVDSIRPSSEAPPTEMDLFYDEIREEYERQQLEENNQTPDEAETVNEQ